MANQLSNVRYEIIVQIVTSYGTYSDPSGAVITYPLTTKNHYVDTYDVTPITIDFQVADCKDISSKKGSRSYTITVPETANNRFVFGNISDLSGNNYNANKKAECWVLEDTNVVFKGILQLVDATVNTSTNEVQYDLNIFDDNVGFYDALGDGFLTDDDYSYLSHTYSSDNIINSWDNNWELGYYYPLIDYGRGWNIQLMNGSGGLSHSFTASNPTYDPGYVNVQDFFPAVYVKTVMNQLFFDTGYTYNSNFFNSDIFQNLIIPQSTDLLVDKQYQLDREFRVGLTDTWNLELNQEFGIPFDNYDSPNGDPNGLWTDGGGIHGASAYGYYTNQSNDLFQQGFGISMYLLLPADYKYVDIYLNRSQYPDGTPIPTFPQNNAHGQGGQLIVYNNQTFYRIDNTNPRTEGPQVYLGTASGILGYTGSAYSINLTTPYTTGPSIANMAIRPGESVAPVLFVTYQSPYTDRGGYLGSQSYFFNSVNPHATPGAYLGLNSTLPKQLKKKEFFMEIVNMFNLIVQPDPNNPNSLIIEPYNDFFNGNINDYTLKIDTLVPYKEKLIAEVQNRTILFSYKLDKDYYNQDYQHRSQETYGQYKYIIDNDFLQGEKKVELKFSSTPLVAVPESDGSGSSLVIPVINNNSPLTSGTTFPQMSYRLLTRTPNSNGLVDLKNPQDSWAFLATFYPQNGTYSGTQATIYEYDQYPYAGHFDDPYNPNYSLNYGTVSGLYYNGSYDPSDNLFGKYWQNMMNEYSDSQSRILTLNLFLNSFDISQLSFRNLVYLDADYIRGYYKVNKISQYQPGINQSVEVELLKTNFTQIPKTQIPQVPTSLGFRNTNTSVVSTSNTNTFIAPHSISIGSGNYITLPHTSIFGMGNVVSGLNTSVSGNNNIINSHRSLVIGNSNVIESPTSSNTNNSSNFVFGSNVTLASGISDVFSIGSGITLTQSNVIQLGNSQSTIIVPTGATFVSNLTLQNVMDNGNVTTDNLITDGDVFIGIYGTCGVEITTFGVEGKLNIYQNGQSQIQMGSINNKIALPNYTSPPALVSPPNGNYLFTDGSGTLVIGSVSDMFSAISTPETMVYFDVNGNLNGIFTVNESLNSFAEGNGSVASGLVSHAEGSFTTASGIASHAEGENTSASGQASHAEGGFTVAAGDYSHAEGFLTLASNLYAHTEGYITIASGQSAHAEGQQTQATGNNSHAEGVSTIASGLASHAEGNSSLAYGDYSYAGGYNGVSEHYSEWSRGASFFSNYGIISYSGTTNNNTPTELFLDGSSVRFTVATSSIYYIRISEGIASGGTGIQFTTFYSESYVVSNNAGTITLQDNIGSQTSISLVNDITTGSPINGISAAISPDNTNKSLKLTVTGLSSVIIGWVYKIEYTRIR